MSRRYWSKDPDGLDRSKARAFPVRTWAIITLEGGCRTATMVVGDQKGWKGETNIGFTGMDGSSKSTHFHITNCLWTTGS